MKALIRIMRRTNGKAEKVKMEIATVLVIAFGLAMDAFAVSVASGLAVRQQRINTALKMAGAFGLFQAVMPVMGWLAGLSLTDLVSGVDHWVAFGLLGFVGCKMIYETLKKRPDEKGFLSLSVYGLLVLAIATSIDAFAVGLSFAFLEVSIITPILVIGTVTFVLSFLGVSFGNRVGSFFGNKIGVAGGLVLLGIGIKILVNIQCELSGCDIRKEVDNRYSSYGFSSQDQY
jgi:putative Mn2+ efflux pump MntP